MKTFARIAVAAAALTASAASAAPLAGNPGFEVAGSGPSVSALWVTTGGGPAGTLSQRSSLNPFAGQWSQLITAVGSNAAGASAGISQNTIADLGLASLQPGSSLGLSFRGNYDLAPGGVGFYVLRILNGSGAIVADTGLQAVTATTSGYQLFSTALLTVPAFGAAPNDTYAAFIEINVAAGAFAGSTASAYIDEVNINGTLVPAPASLSLLAAGLVAAARRRRVK